MSPSQRSDTSAMLNCTCFNLRMAARAVTQLYDGFLRPVNLRATQLSLLAVLERAGRISITRLAEVAVMDRTTLTRNLGPLEREGLVRIEPGADARVREVSLTRAGRDRLAAALPHWERAQAHVTGRLGAGRTQRFLSDLSAAIAATQKEAAP